MHMICVSHAEARVVDPPFIFRALTEQGRREMRAAAAGVRERLEEVVPALAAGEAGIGRIVSSPLARCVESLLVFADELQDLTKTSEIECDVRLRERRGCRLLPDELVSVVNAKPVSVALLGTHGDLAGALPRRTGLREEAAHEGWFAKRPVVAVLEYEPHTPWDSARVTFCHAFAAEIGEDLLA